MWRNYRNTLAVTAGLLIVSAALTAGLAIGLFRQSQEIAHLQASLTRLSQQQEQRFDAHQVLLKGWGDALLTDVKDTWRAYDSDAQQRESHLFQGIQDARRAEEAETKRLHDRLDTQSKQLQNMSQTLTRLSVRSTQRP